MNNTNCKKFKGKKFEILETDEGILLKPTEDSIKQARGILKGCRFNSKIYEKQKQNDSNSWRSGEDNWNC